MNKLQTKLGAGLWRAALLLGALLIVIPTVVAAETFARTDGGRRVVLNEDGTWEFSDDENAPTINGGFRGVPWQSSREAVIEIEGSATPTHTDDKFIVYDTKLLGLDFFAVYYFSDDKLVRGRYVLTEEHSNRNDFIQDFLKIKAALESKYGGPEADNTYWRNDLYQDDTSEYGFAVSLGHLTYEADWTGAETDIALQLSGENYDISLLIEYTANSLRYLEERDRQRVIDDKL